MSKTIEEISESRRRNALKRYSLLDGSWYPHIPDLCHCKNFCGTIVYNYKLFVRGHSKSGTHHSEESKQKSTIAHTKTFLIKPDGSKEIYPPIPSLCKDGCGTIVYNGKQYVQGHNPIKSHIAWNKNLTKFCDDRVKNVANKLKGKPKSELHKQHLSDNHWKKRPENKDSYRGDKNPFANCHHKKSTKDNLRKIHIGKHYSLKTEIKSGQHLSLDTEFKLGSIPPREGGWGKGKYYNSPLQGTIWLRSSYETKYALYLDRNKIPWLYEPKAFPFVFKEKQTTYRPDFLLLVGDIKFIDTKGYYDKENIEKIKCFKEAYTKIKLEVLFEKDLIKLGIKV